MKYIKKFKIYENLKVTDIEQEFDFFHISTKKLGDTFLFTPRIPDTPFTDSYDDIIEDNFTERVSLAKTIKGCLDAINDEDVDGYYIYAIKKQDMDLKYLVDLSKKETPIGYGVDFKLSSYTLINNKGNMYNSPKDLPYDLRKQFYGCVPDCNITGEYWYLNHIKMEYIGEIMPWKYGFDIIVN